MFTREAHPAVRRKEPARTHQRAGGPGAGSQTQPRRPTFQRGYFSASASPSEPQNSPAADREDFPPAGGRGKMNTREAEGRALAARDPAARHPPGPAHQLRQLRGSRRLRGRHRLRLRGRGGGGRVQSSRPRPQRSVGSRGALRCQFFICWRKRPSAQQ